VQIPKELVEKGEKSERKTQIGTLGWRPPLRRHGPEDSPPQK